MDVFVFFSRSSPKLHTYPDICICAKNLSIANYLKDGLQLRKEHCNEYVFNGQRLPFLKCAPDHALPFATHNDMPRIWNSIRT